LTFGHWRSTLSTRVPESQKLKKWSVSQTDIESLNYCSYYGNTELKWVNLLARRSKLKQAACSNTNVYSSVKRRERFTKLHVKQAPLIVKNFVQLIFEQFCSSPSDIARTLTWHLLILLINDSIKNKINLISTTKDRITHHIASPLILDQSMKWRTRRL